MLGVHLSDSLFLEEEADRPMGQAESYVPIVP